MSEITTDLPECPNGHGPMVLRPVAFQSRDALWCGTWYDCPPGPPGSHCASSALVPSAELEAQLREQAMELER